MITINNLESLKKHILLKRPTLFAASQTSTVIPFTDAAKNHSIAQLNLPGTVKLENSTNELMISGNISWQECISFAHGKGRAIRSYPTEELATPLAGISTSATGERSFGKGTLKNDVSKINYVGFDGEEHTLLSSRPVEQHKIFNDLKSKELLKKYQESFKKYEDMKNGPIPRLQNECDLMVGTEGQLGVITKIQLATDKWIDSTHMFIKVDKWENSTQEHEELINKVRAHRELFIACELLDSNSLKFLPKEDRPCSGQDIIILEIKKDCFDNVYENVITPLTTIREDNIFEIPSSKMHKIRMDVPRFVQEHNKASGAFKSGTDTQVYAKDFSKLIEYYRRFAKENIPYLLFGHIGDYHLHFNFLNQPNFQNRCDQLFMEMYKDCLKWNGSPFAEHGIGILKQKYIRPFFEPIHFEMFRHLKKSLDPLNQFFPAGFMNISETL